MHGETISDAALLVIADDCIMQMRGGTCDADHMTKKRTGFYWGDSGFLDYHRKTLSALDYLVEKGKVLKGEKQIDINGKQTTVPEYHLRFA